MNNTGRESAIDELIVFWIILLLIML